jgi:hypothetical protein
MLSLQRLSISSAIRIGDPNRWYLRSGLGAGVSGFGKLNKRHIFRVDSQIP